MPSKLFVVIERGVRLPTFAYFLPVDFCMVHAISKPGVVATVACTPTKSNICKGLVVACRMAAAALFEVRQITTAINPKLSTPLSSRPTRRHSPLLKNILHLT